MSAAPLEEGHLFVSIKYLIDQGGPTRPPREVEGWAFEIPGWPEFHCCVRHDFHHPTSLFNEWIIDHFESGYHVGVTLKCKEDAPLVMKQKLDAIGKKKVRRAIEERKGVRP